MEANLSEVTLFLCGDVMTGNRGELRHALRATMGCSPAKGRRASGNARPGQIGTEYRTQSRRASKSVQCQEET